MTFPDLNRLPTAAELPCSDDIPVDNEDQNLLPNLLLLLLTYLWSDRLDWYFGVDMAIYHTTGLNPRVPVVPDAFLSLGRQVRKKGGKSRRSYVVWEEEKKELCRFGCWKWFSISQGMNIQTRWISMPS